MKYAQHWSRLLCWMLIVLPGYLPAQQFQFENYQYAEGLNNIDVHDLAFDKAGFLWIATENGLFRLLGSHFEHYGPEQGMPDRAVNTVYVDPEARLWAGTNESLYLLRGNRFEAVGTPAHPVEPGHFGIETAPPFSIQSSHHILEIAKNRLWLIDRAQLLDVSLDASNHYLSHKPVFSEAEIKAHPELDSVDSLAMAKDGVIWFTCDTKVCSITAGKLKIWSAPEGVTAQPWRNIFIDHRGWVWLGTKDTLLALPFGGKAFVDRTPPGRDPQHFFYWAPILEDRQGRILATTAAGLVRYDGASWQPISAANGLKDDRITSLAIDGNGDPWIGTLGGISHWIGYEHWESWTQTQGLPAPPVFSLNTVKPGQVLLGTRKGPALLDSSQNEIVSLFKGGPWRFSQVGWITQDGKGRIWACTFSGEVILINPATLWVKSIAQLSIWISQMFIARDQRLWLITGNGIQVVDDPKSSTTLLPVAEPDRLLPHRPTESSIRMAVESKIDSDIWFIALQGLLRFHQGTWSKVSIFGLDLSPVEFRGISSAADGTLWICGFNKAKHAAVWRLSPVSGGMQAVSLELPEGLRAASPMSILIDHRGWLWMGTDNGLAGWNRSTWRIFNQESGLVSNDLSPGALSEAPDGSIWIGSSYGAARLFRPESAFAPVPLTLSLTEMQASDRTELLPHSARVAWRRGTFRFRFESPIAWNRSSLSFSYRLLGLDSSWTSTQSAEANFSDLPPGKYRFQAFAENPGLSARSAVLELPFEVLPPWWRTLWFYTVCGISSVLLLWLLHRLRTRHLLLNQAAVAAERQDVILEERAHMAREVHDKLARGYAAILFQQHALRGSLKNDPQAASQHLDSIERLSKDHLAQARKTLEELKADPTALGNLRRAIEQCVQQQESDSHCRVNLIMDADLPLLPRYVENELCRVIGEALNNANKHSRTTAVDITIARSPDGLNIQIQDYGIGFKPGERTASFGIPSMHERSARAGAELTITSAPGSGTLVLIKLKL